MVIDLFSRVIGCEFTVVLRVDMGALKTEALFPDFCRGIPFRSLELPRRDQ